MRRVCAGREGFTLSPGQTKALKADKFEDLGAGTHACVYEVDGKVVKITGHKSDAAAAIAVAQKPVQGVLRVRGVERVGDYYYAVKSDKVDRPTPSSHLAQRCATEGLMHMAFINRANARQKAPAKITQETKACVLKNAPRIGIKPVKVLKFLGELSKTQARLQEKTGVIWYDVGHEGNFTQDAKGRPLIVDLGASTVPDRFYAALARKKPLR